MTEQEPKKFDPYWIWVTISLLVGIGLPALIIDTFYPDIGTYKLIGSSLVAFVGIIIGYVYVWGIISTILFDLDAHEKVILLIVVAGIISFICLLLITYTVVWG